MRFLPSGYSETDNVSKSEPEPESPQRARPHRLVEGAKGGVVATLVMTAYRLPIAHSLPPTALFWAKYVAGGDPDDYPLPALVLHLLYGTAAGVAFAGLALGDGPRETVRREELGLLWGVGYGFVLSIFGERVVLKRVLDLNLEADERLVFHVGHLVYGLTLGTWLGSRTDDR